MMAGSHVGRSPACKTGENVMHKLVIAVAVSAAFGILPVCVAAADDTDAGKHQHTNKHRAPAAPTASSEAEVNPAVRDGYRMNGNFDWRRRGENEVPWYAHGYNDNCVAWEQNAYHYACDVNSRY
jgi:hypothetical protein